MTPEQIDNIQAGFVKVRPTAQAAAALFHGRLFQIAPALEPLFKGDLAEQGNKLMPTLAAVMIAAYPAQREAAHG